MNYRKFGKTDLLVSETGFGAWAIGGPAMAGNIPIGWGNSDDKDSTAALKAALDNGINFFDTADFYGLGHSEKLIGKVFSNSDKVIVATKVGQKPGTDRPVEIDYSRKYLLNACEASLKRLRRESIDYYQLHVASVADLEKGECVDAMERLRDSGKIRYWGISLFTFNPAPEAEWLMQ
ncbi:MAG: aldo/keto reductase, partial [Gemmatimonadaceae bacterium]|nr:aldo/keto reductase [Chitinophagaceae bacterium]